jgi:hypothetical protein
MNLADRIQRLERKLAGKTEEIRLEDGSIVRLPENASLEAFVAVMNNLKRGSGEPLERVPYEDVFRQAVPPTPMDLIGFVREMLEQQETQDSDSTQEG